MRPARATKISDRSKHLSPFLVLLFHNLSAIRLSFLAKSKGIRVCHWGLG